MNWMIDGLYGDLYRTAMGCPPLRPHDGREFAGMTPAPQAAAPTASARRGIPDALRDMFAWLNPNWRSAS